MEEGTSNVDNITAYSGLRFGLEDWDIPDNAALDNIEYRKEHVVVVVVAAAEKDPVGVDEEEVP